jgi:threonine synthase
LKDFDDIVKETSEEELPEAAARADLTGMYACPHTGVALASLFRLVERGEIRSDERVIVVSTAHGLKFTNFKIGYHEGTLEGVSSTYANPPVELPPDVDAVRDVILRRLDA